MCPVGHAFVHLLRAMEAVHTFNCVVSIGDIYLKYMIMHRVSMSTAASKVP